MGFGLVIDNAERRSYVREKGMRPGPGRGPAKEEWELLVSPSNPPARSERTHNGPPRASYSSFLAVLACLCLVAPAGAAQAGGSRPTPDPAPTGGISADPAPTGGAAAPVPVKRVVPRRQVAPQPIAPVAAPAAPPSPTPTPAVHATRAPAPQPVAASAHASRKAGRSGHRRAHRRARTRHIAAPRPDRAPVVELPRPEAAVRFLGVLPVAHLVADTSARGASNGPLVLAAIALLLVVAAEGAMLRLSGHSPRRP